MAAYIIHEGKLHKGGTVHAEIVPDPNHFTVKVNYEIHKKMLVPVPSQYLKGEYTFELPSQFKDERGYLELESKNEIDTPKARVKFLKRTEVNGKKNGFLAEVLPNNGKSKITVAYHPDLPSLGWGRVEITLLIDFPGLNGYKLIAEIK